MTGPLDAAESQPAEVERQRFALLIEASDDFVAMTALDGTLLYLNPAGRRMLGAEGEEEHAGVSFDAYLAEEGQRVYREQELPALRRDGHWQGVSQIRNLATGATIDVQVTSFIVADPETGEPGYIGTVKRDITELKRHDEEIHRLNAELERRVEMRTTELQQANAELEAFAYSVAHDLRSPLRAIDGFSQALREDYSGRLDDTAADYIARVCAATSRMGDLIDDLLKLSRISRAELRHVRVDLSAMALEIAQELADREPDRAVQFDIADGLTVTGDGALLRIMLENLLGNAWKFTGDRASARIAFGATTDGNERVFFVRDDGVGFEMEYVQKLFTPFQRLHADASFPGTGIGLATVQRIVRRHHGRVWAEGTSGRGATFYFALGAEEGD